MNRILPQMPREGDQPQVATGVSAASAASTPAGVYVSPATRDERLAWEDQQMRLYESLLAADAKGGPSRITVEREGDPPRQYTLTYKCRSLRWDSAERQPAYTGEHRVRITLGATYPIYPPVVFALTPVYHPNIGDGRNGGYVCPRGEHTFDRRVADIAYEVGEMLRMAVFWSTPTTQDVIEELKSLHIALPTDSEPFTAPPMPVAQPIISAEVYATTASGTTGVRVHLPQAITTLEAFAHQAISRIVEQSRLPTEYPNGTGIPYELRPADESDGKHSSLPKLILYAPGLEQMKPITRVAPMEALGRFQQANPATFGFRKVTEDESSEHYRLRFGVEVLAPSIGPYNEKALVRTKHNEIDLIVPRAYPQAQLSATWLTAILHPQIEEGHPLTFMSDQGQSADLILLLNMIARLLNYELEPNLKIVNQDAVRWIESNADRVQWLRTNTTRLRPAGVI